jgi:hypothetical protein
MIFDIRFTVLFLGLKILKVERKLSSIIPYALAGSFIAVFIKSFVPNPLAFFISLVPLLVFLKILSKARWIVSAWVVVLLLLVNTIGPWLLISPLSSINRSISFFFFENKFGLPIIGLIETFSTAFFY